MAIDKDAFQERLTRFVQAWKDDLAGAWGSLGVVLVTTGKRDMEVLQYLKSVAFHNWLFGIEVTDVTVALSQKAMRVLTYDGNKAVILRTLIPAAEAAGVALDIIAVNKGTPGEAEMATLLQFARAEAGEKAIAGLPKLKQAGPLHDAFQAHLKGSGLELADAGLALAVLLAIHDKPAALQNTKKAGFLTSSVMNAAQKRIEGDIDGRKSVKHSALSEAISTMVRTPSKCGIKLKPQSCDVAYLPVVQSGGVFNLRVGAESDDSRLHDGVVVVHFGAKYNSECSNICRTLFFNPDAQMEQVYGAVLAAQKAAIAALVPGAPLSAAHAAAHAALKAAVGEDVLAKLGKSVGFAMGLELREAKLQLTASADVAVQAGMVFNVSVGLSDLDNAASESSRGKVYAVQVADSVLVAAGGGAPEVLTRFSAADWNAVSYEVKSEAEGSGSEGSDMEASDVEEMLRDPKRSLENRDQNLGRGRRTANKASETAEHQAELAELKKKQDALSVAKNEETYKRLTSKADAKGTAESLMRSVTQTECYSALEKVPPRGNLLVSVDANAECILLPIMGVLVPFHITTVKGLSYSQDGEAQEKVHSYVRIQFNTMPAYEARAAHPKAVLIKELSFRSAKPEAAHKFVQEATALRRQVLMKDKEAAERATLVKQEKLQRFTNRQPQRLNDLWVFPAISSRRKLSGTLEAHYNGFRYSLPGGASGHLDITYSNIKHAVLQEAERELIALLHLHLKNPIMVGKKKVMDVQFYTEVMSDAAATADARRSAYDPDELEEEQRERERRKRINLDFKRFVRRVQDSWDKDFPRLKLEWDTPYRDLAFQGNTGKSTVVLMPTVNCLVQLVEAPYTVISLDDIEIVSLERVGFNCSTFDLVIVFKDFSRDAAAIGSVPAKQLDEIKKWLSTQDIKFFESKIPLQWKKILKQITDDPEGFMEVGGWAGFLDADGSDEEDDDGEESDGFAPSGASGSDASGSESEDESLIDEEEEGSEDYSADSDEEEGKDWDELMEEAKRSDKLRDEAEGQAEGDDRRGAKRAGGGGARGPPAKKRK